MSPQAITSRDLEVALHEFVVRARLEASAQTPGLLASKPPQDGLSSLVTLRLDILQMLLMADPSVVRSLLSHAAFRERALLIATGLLFEPREGLPEELFAEIRKVYSRSWDQANWINLFACAQLCFQPFELPPHPDPDSLPDDVFSAYLDYCLTTPAFFQLGDDTRYVAHIGQMIRLLTLSLETTNPLPRRLEAFRFATTVLNLNALTHVDVDVRDTLAARGELIERLNLMGRDTQDVETALPARSTDLTLATKRRIRIGFYVRTILFGPDTNVLWSDICRLDPARYEVILYSSDSYDRSYIHDVAFYKQLLTVVSGIRSLKDLPVNEAVVLIRKDALDVFIQSNATSLGAKNSDRILAHKLAPVQVAINRILALSTGLPSFDYFLAAPSPRERLDGFQRECTEKVRAMPTSMLAYTPPPDPPPLDLIDRKRLGISDGEIVLLSGAAVDKLVPALLDCWARILAAVPEARLVLVPFNPAWGGRLFNRTLRHRLRVAFAPHGVSTDRVVLLDERHPRDVNQLLKLADIFLGSFPHAGATWLMKAIYFGVPPVVRGGPWLRGTGDQSFVRSVGLPELVGEETEDYVAVAVRLASDPAFRAEMRRRLAATRDTASFLEPESHSLQFADVIEALLAESGLLVAPEELAA